jgi:hypothetical protein
VAVSPDKADAFAGIDAEADVFKKRLRAVAFGDVFNCDHGAFMHERLKRGLSAVQAGGCSVRRQRY